uniref:RING-type E3 ubiquitin transferase n=1 Tax=Sphaeramia orbicularis TaxID=375764 RepID=A0A673AW88_9TELE
RMRGTTQQLFHASSYSLLQWLKHSRKEYCELCKYRFAFTPIYSPDMPSRLPLQDIFSGLIKSLARAIRYWFHYTLVAFAWLGVVPLTAYRIYKCLFTGSVSSLLALPLDMISTKDMLLDCVHGGFVVTCTLSAFISLVWLREQIVHGGGPQWLEQNQPPLVPNQPNGPAAADEVPGGHGAADEAADRRPADPDAAPADPHQAGNHGDEAELDDDEDEYDDDEDDDEDDDNDEDDEEEEEDADPNNRGAELHWNAMEWDRAAEELTWERVSIRFLCCVLICSCFSPPAFCPYHIGHFSVVGLGFEEYIRASNLDGPITTLVGYILLAVAFILFHALASLVKFQRSRRLLGVGYIVVKVSLLVVMEIGLFPLICGWWLDICSLEMFNASLRSRGQNLDSAPGTTLFLHWLVGMVYVFYFASFILLLREVLRPGVLWFLRNLNDPDFNPVQEMIQLPIYRHLRRFILSVVVFGSLVLLMLWLPVQIIKLLFPDFLPYNVMLFSDAPVSELSLELLLLQVVLPALLEQGHTRQWLKQLIHAWTFTAGYALDLHSYLLGEHEDEDNQPNNNAPGRHNNNRIPGLGEGLHAAHQAFLQQGGPLGFQPYYRPRNFPLKIGLLVVLMCVTLLMTSLICLTLPVCVGRWVMSFWMGTATVHELYTAASGLYVCWLSVRTATVLVSWVPQGPTVILSKAYKWIMTAVAVLLLGVIPLLLGVLFELVFIIPLRVPLVQTPLLNPWQDWAMGVLHAKIIAAITLMGPQWWFKTVIEQVYADGIRDINVCFIARSLAAPVVCVLLLFICVPYTIAKGITPLLGVQPWTQILVERRIYPFMLMFLLLLALLFFQIQQFKRLYEHIKNDKYLVGQRLVNYEHKKHRSSSKYSHSTSS